MVWWLYGVLLTLAWGAGAFGSPYPWAYTPLLFSSSCLGIIGLWVGRRQTGLSPALLVGFTLIGLSILAQLVPLPLSRVEELSPHANAIVGQRDLLPHVGATGPRPLSIDPLRTRLGSAFFGAFAVLLIGTARALTRERAESLASSVVILGAALATIGIVQRATWNGKIYGFWELVQGGTPFGPFVNKNHFAGWMLMGLPIAMGYFLALVSRGMQGRKPGFREFVLWFSSERANRTVLTGFAILVMALSLVLTMSRSGISAGVLSVVVAGAVTARRQVSASRRILTAGFLIFLLIAVASWVGLDQIVLRFADIDAMSIYERPAIWIDAFGIAGDFWLTGTGLNTFGVSSLFYQKASPGAHLMEAHSDYLQLAAEGGLLLGLPIIITIFAFASEVRRRIREDVGSVVWIRLGAVISLLAIALQSTVEFSLQMPGNAAMFAVVAALAIHDGRRQHTAHDSP